MANASVKQSSKFREYHNDMRESFRLLKNVQTNMKLGKDPTYDFQLESAGILDKTFKSGIINIYEKAFLYIENLQTSYFYQFPKMP